MPSNRWPLLFRQLNEEDVTCRRARDEFINRPTHYPFFSISFERHKKAATSIVVRSITSGTMEHIRLIADISLTGASFTLILYFTTLLLYFDTAFSWNFILLRASMCYRRINLKKTYGLCTSSCRKERETISIFEYFESFTMNLNIIISISVKTRDLHVVKIVGHSDEETVDNEIDESF